jgi:hypothetical protein
MYTYSTYLHTAGLHIMACFGHGSHFAASWTTRTPGGAGLSSGGKQGGALPSVFTTLSHSFTAPALVPADCKLRAEPRPCAPANHTCAYCMQGKREDALHILMLVCCGAA